MKLTAMNEKVYDLKQLEELAAGSHDFVDSMIETYLKHTPGQMEEMLDAHRQGDFVKMGELAHKIKPNIDLFDIQGIRAEIREIEKDGKAGRADSQTENHLSKVQEVLRISFEQMNRR